MKLIVITPEQMLEGEAEALNRLFAQGLEVLHLRKPNATLHDMRSILEKINPDYYHRIVLHDQVGLADVYTLRGVHLNRRNPNLPANKKLMVSKSCHALHELTNSEPYSYLFLSPVFNSISKTGYRQAFAEEELITARNAGIICSKVYALGGVSVEQIPLAARFGFGGVVVLGALWGRFGTNGDIDDLLRRFEELQSETRKTKTE